MLVLINIEDLNMSRTDWTGTAGRVTFHFKIFDHEKTFTRFKFSFDLDLDLLVAVAEVGGFGADEVSHALELDVHLGTVGYIDDQLREVGPHVGAIVGVEDSDIDQHSLE